MRSLGLGRFFLERERSHLERGGSGRGTFWRLSRPTGKRLSLDAEHLRPLRTNLETAKTRIVAMLRREGSRGMSNTELRGLALLTREQVKRVMSELRDEGVVESVGERRGARWVLRSGGYMV